MSLDVSSTYCLQLAKQHAKKERPVGSVLLWLDSLSPKDKGKMGEDIAKSYYQGKGHKVDFAPTNNSYFDLILDKGTSNEKRVEVKFSAAEQNRPIFNHIKTPIDSYDEIFCYWQRDFDAQIWIIPNSVVPKLIKKGAMTPQQGGKTQKKLEDMLFKPGVESEAYQVGW